jgi:hypothetical protein
LLRRSAPRNDSEIKLLRPQRILGALWGKAFLF